VGGAVVGASDDHDGEDPAGGPQTAATGSGMPLREQVGQVLVSSFDEPRLPDYLRRRLRDGETTGAILFGRNVASRDELRALTNDLQRAAGGGALVLTDQEGGPVRILGFAGPPLPQPAQRTPDAVEDQAAAAARELRAVGANVTLAPVADVALGPALGSRAFAGPPSAVARLVGASVRGWRRGRVAATAKHFPGLGRAALNTDDAPATISASRATLAREDLVPFRAAVASRAPLIMASHALYPALDPERIASQSPAILQRLLREELGYRGVVVTDSIEADAALRRGSVAVAAERSLAAGADLILLTGSRSWKLVFPHLVRRARRSSALRARIAASAARVARLKRALGLRAP
jgi:beta-N-acetylhexosaminidase